MVTTTVEGPRALRRDGALSRASCAANPQQIEREVLVPTMDGAMVPLGQVAGSPSSAGAPGIRTENALLSAYIFVDIRDRDIGGVPTRRKVVDQVKFPPGYYATWSGQFEYMERARGEAEDRRAGDAADHLPAAVPQLPPPDRDADRHAVGAVRAGRRRLADVAGWATTCRWRWRWASSRWPAWPPRPAW